MYWWNKKDALCWWLIKTIHQTNDNQDNTNIESKSSLILKEIYQFLKNSMKTNLQLAKLVNSASILNFEKIGYTES